MLNRIDLVRFEKEGGDEGVKDAESKLAEFVSGEGKGVDMDAVRKATEANRKWALAKKSASTQGLPLELALTQQQSYV